MRWRSGRGELVPNYAGSDLEQLASEHRTLPSLAERFRRFAVEECSEGADEGAGSRVYELLSEAVADSEDLLELARLCRVGQPIPNLLFGAVKRVVMDHPDAELARHYDHTGAGSEPDCGLARAFSGFVVGHRDRIARLLETRMVQTNEVGRCAYLMPGFSAVAMENPSRPLAMVDVGASAGLNLLWDRYRYRYSNGAEFGPPESGVLVECEARNGMPELPAAFPAVNFRVGIDLAPVNLSDEEEYRWMRALIWPGHGDRAARLSAARDIWLENPPMVHGGDALELLPEVIRAVPEEFVLCVFHCHTLNQFSAEGRGQFAEILRQGSMKRVVYHLSSEGERMSVNRIVGGESTTALSARRQAHGRWIEWDTDARVSSHSE